MATYYFRNAGVNWGDAANWSLTDGGGATGAVPLATDDAYFTSNSGNCTVNATARVCRTLIFSGVGAGNYANTFTVDNNVTVSGNVTLSATMTITGTANLRINATSTLTSNGITWSGGLTIVGNQTVTLSGNWTINGSFDTTNTTGTATINNNTLTIGGGFTSTITSGSVTGTTNIVLNGTGTLATNAVSNGAVFNNITINTTGEITLGTTFRYSGGTFTYTLGLVTTSGSTFIIGGTGATINTDGIIWNNIRIAITSITITLLSNLTCYGNLSITDTAAAITLNGFTIFIGGSFTANTITTGTIGGTTNIVLNGNGTLSTTNVTSGGISNSITIDTTGTYIFSGRINFSGSSFIIKRGRIITTGNRLYIRSSCTFSFKGINFNNVIITAGRTITMDEFFSGAPDQKATITSTTTSNYTITFTDGFERFAKFVNINNATITRRGQLVLITNEVVPSTTLGIRRINSFPNGVGSQGNFKQLYLDGVPPIGDTRLLTSDSAFN